MGRRDKAKDLSPALEFPLWPFDDPPVLLNSLQEAQSICDQLKLLRESVKDDNSWIWLLQCRFAAATPLQFSRSIDSQWNKRPPQSVNTRDIIESVYQSFREDLHALSEFVTWWIKQKDACFDLQIILDDISPSFVTSIGEEAIQLAAIIAALVQSMAKLNIQEKVAKCVWDILMDHRLTYDTRTTLSLAYARIDPKFVDQLESVEDLHRRMSLVAAYVVTASDLHLQRLRDLSFDVASSARDPDVRVVAWKCLRTILRRSDTIQWEETLNLILSAWEHPPTRALELAIPPVFQIFQARHPKPEDLIKPILEQPLRSKGRYIALQYLVDYLQEDQKAALSKELVEYLGNFSHTVVAVADLYGKLISTGHFEADLACQLTAPNVFSRRQQILAYSLPMIVNRPDAKDSVLILLQSIRGTPEEERIIENETTRDRLVWCLLEVIRYSEKVIMEDAELQSFVQSFLQKDISEYLLHFSERVRLPAFQCLHIVFYERDNLWLSIQEEETQWRRVLLWNAKTESREFVSSLFLSLALFMDRMIQQECCLHTGQDSCALSAFRSFVVDFLLGTIVRALGYPGTVVDKERFLLVLLECVIVFSTRDHSMAKRSKLIPKTSKLRSRKRSQLEETLMVEIRKALLGKEIFAALFVLLRSAWDPIRSSAFSICAGLIELASDEVHLPAEFQSYAHLEWAILRSTDMASSPKPRLADSGARMLALFFKCSGSKERFLSDCVNTLEIRLDKISAYLKKIVDNDDLAIVHGEELPMAHGIIQAWKLILDDDSFPAVNGAEKSVHGTLDRLLAVLHRALQLSLTIVADVKDGETLECATDFEIDSSYRQKAAVNPGALGANGIFSSLKGVSDEENDRRYRSQRIVVGSWLLTKESCDALSSLLDLEGYLPDFRMYKRSGDLLLNTLTALKHAGAAFAAHRSLQHIAISCFNRKASNGELGCLPYEWAEWILKEISGSERIRDSTLRRSMGYSLGLLSLMRAELTSNGLVERSFTKKTLWDLVRFSLPSELSIRQLATQLGDAFVSSIYVSEKSDIDFLDHTVQSVRTRVHALNALRLIVLDAPLSQEAMPLLGISMISAIVGHFDSEWSIRNSASLLFSAAMQRAIDRDKNGSGVDATAKKAFRADQLFQSYPSLRSFLIAAFKGCDVTNGSHGTAELPIMTILSRIQRIRHSNPDSLQLVEVFVPFLLCLLGNRHVTTRLIAARALGNLCADADTTSASGAQLFTFCLHSLQVTEKPQWNLFHGCLLLIEQLLVQHVAGDTTEIEEKLAAMAVMSEEIPFAPLSCVTLALSCLSLFPRSCEWLIARCSSAKVWLETGSEKTQQLAAYGDLGATLGKILADASCTYLCDQNADLSSEASPVSCLFSLLCSVNLDVRSSAAKVFKKALPAVLEGKLDQPFRRLCLERVHRAFSDELLHRSRPHTPTLRRLTRCLLDLLNTESLRLDEEFQDSISTATLALAGLVWQKQSPGEISKLHGYSIELIVYHIGAEQQGVLSDIPWILAKLDILLHPYNDFRVRHSATLAIRTLWSSPLVRSTERWTSALFRLWVRTTQDSNGDVRDASSSLLSASLCSREKLISDVSFYRTLRRGVNNRHLASGISQLANAQESGGVENKPAKVFAEEKLNSYEEPPIVAELLSLAFLREGFIPAAHDMSDFERFCLCLETALTECSDPDDAKNHRVLGFLFRDLHQSPRIFVLATTVLALKRMVAPATMLALRLPKDSDEFHPTVRELLHQLSCNGGNALGEHHYLTSSLET